VLIALLVAALFWLPKIALALLAAAIVAAAAIEWARLCRLGSLATGIYAALIAAAFALLLATGKAMLGFEAAALFWIVIVPFWLTRGVRTEQRGALLASGFCVLVPAGLALVALPPTQVLMVLVLVWIADSAAYFVGRKWGRRKLAPTISPGKSWEGAAGGLCGALAYAIILAAFTGRDAWAAAAAVAVLLAAISIVGDLFESAAKRQAGVKDSGALLPGHGGILDRIDSATATLPLAALLLPWMRANA
jgi:phosphatidate cytidylyltransferase